MRLKLVLKFDDAEREALLVFQEAINSQGPTMSLEQVCKQAIYYAISDSYKRARAEKERQDKLVDLQAQSQQQQVQANEMLHTSQQLESANGGTNVGDIAEHTATLSPGEITNSTVEAAQDSADQIASAT